MKAAGNTKTNCLLANTLYSYRFLLGDPERALTDPASIVLTKSLANMIFGREDVMGEMLRSSMRARDVGIRRLLGGSRPKLVLRFLLESFVITALAVFCALLIIEVVMPWYREFAGISLTLYSLNLVMAILSLLAGVVFVGMLSGLYPALYLTSVVPIDIFRGKQTGGKKGAFFRKALIVFQFAISLPLIPATVVINLQLAYMRNKDLGIDLENRYLIRLEANTHFLYVAEPLARNLSILHLGWHAAQRDRRFCEPCNNLLHRCIPRHKGSLRCTGNCSKIGIEIFSKETLLKVIFVQQRLSVKKHHFEIAVGQCKAFCTLFVGRCAGVAALHIFPVKHRVAHIHHFGHHFSGVARVHPVVAGGGGEEHRRIVLVFP